MKKPSYSSKMSFIRPFVSFDLKRPERSVPKTKSKITRYYNYLQGIRNDYAAVEVPGRYSFEDVQKDLNPTFRRVPKKFKKTEFKVLFVPNAKVGAKIRVRGRGKKKKYALESNGVLESIIHFEDVDAFIENVKEYIDSLIKKYPPRTFFRLFNPQDWHDEKFDKGSIGNAVSQFFNTFYRDATRSVERGHSWGLIVEERIQIQGG